MKFTYTLLLTVLLTAALKAQPTPPPWLGKYVVKFKNNKIRYQGTLTINKYNAFEFRASGKEMACMFSLGEWTQQGDTLTIHSFKEDELPDQFQFQTLFCQWKKFDQSRFLIKKKKLIALRKNRRGRWKRGSVYTQRK